MLFCELPQWSVGVKLSNFSVQVRGRTFHQAMTGILEQSERDKV
jgi:hypothetical protein